jgi:hypothetical protein
MFEQAVVLSATPGRRAWAGGLGFTIESLVVGTAMLIPMMWPQALPRPQLLIALLEPTAPYVAAHEPPAPSHAQVVPVIKHFSEATLQVPTSISFH